MAGGIGVGKFSADRGEGSAITPGAGLSKKRKKYENLRAQMANERSSFEAHWRDLNDFILPRRARFFLSDTNRGERRNLKIIDSTASLSCRTLRSGMMAGITSPARPWFRLATPDADLDEFPAVKDWLYTVTQRMTTAFIRSNVYNTLPILYGDMGVFASSAMLIDEDFENIIRTQPFPIGSYYIANDKDRKVRVFFREFRMTIRQLVEEFGLLSDNTIDWTRFSSYIQREWEAGNYETWVDVCHVITKNDEYDPRKLQSQFKLYSSCYYEKGTSATDKKGYFRSADDERFLRESGYDYFPVLAPRWEVTGEDVYGTDCPGMTALGDIKQLQLTERRGAQALEKKINPPMTGPNALRATKVSLLPGDVTYVDTPADRAGFRPVHEVTLSLVELENKQEQVRNRIQRSFYEDLFLMLTMSDRREITAREIDERHEEKLLALGPVLEQLNQDLLDPMIDITFNTMHNQGHIPPPPEELQGTKLRVEYTSVMAQAQKLIGLAGIERFAGFAGEISKVNPQALDKVDTDQMLDVYSELTSIPPGIVRSDEHVAAIRQDRAQQAQAAQTAEIAGQAAKAAKDLSGTDTGGKNALTDLISQAQAGQIAPGVQQTPPGQAKLPPGNANGRNKS